MAERSEPILRRPTRTASAATPWVRLLAASLVAAAGGLHLYLWFLFFHRVDTIGPLFLVNAGAAGLIAAALALRGDALVLLAGTAYSAGTLAAFAVSVRWSLFGYHERLWGRWQASAGVVELAATLLLLAELARAARARRR